MLDCFKKDYSKPSRDYGSHGEGESIKPRWGIIIPHTDKSPGAFTPDKKWSEYMYGIHMAKLMKAPHATRDNGGVYGAAKQLIKISQCTASLEPHKNAYNGKVKGAEILIIKGDQLSKQYAELFLDAYAQKFPAANIRGVKEMRKGGRGYKNLEDSKRAGMDIALLSEMFFIDSEWIEPNIMANFWNEVLC